MPTFLLTWNGSDDTYPPGEHAEDVALTAEGRPVRGRWSVGGRTHDLSPNDRVYLLRQHSQRGIVASGLLLDGVIRQDQHWAKAEDSANYVEVVWEAVLGTEDRLAIGDLRANVPNVDWNHILQSGREVRPPDDAILEELWQQHLRQLGAQDAGLRLSGASAVQWLTGKYPGVAHVVDAYLTSISQAFGPDVQYEYVSHVDHDNPRSRDIMIRIKVPIDDEAAWERLIQAQAILLDQEREISRQSSLRSPLSHVSMTIAGDAESWETLQTEIERES